MTKTTDYTESTDEREGSRVADIAEGARNAAEGARNVAEEIAAQIPAAATTTRAMVDEATRQMESSSDLMLTVGTAFAFGLTLGLFLSGSNRLAVGLTLVPAIAMGMTLIDRQGRGELGTSG